MQDSTSGRSVSRNAQENTTPEGVEIFRASRRQASPCAAKSLTRPGRRIVHSRPKNKAATLFKSEIRYSAEGRRRSEHQKLKTEAHQTNKTAIGHKNVSLWLIRHLRNSDPRQKPLADQAAMPHPYRFPHSHRDEALS